MSLIRFLDDLLERGEVIMPRHASAPSREELESSDVILRALDRRARLELAQEPPDLSLAVARWAARMLERICALMADRPGDDEELREALGIPAPEVGTPGAAYSADLVLSYLPDALALARVRAGAGADGDALVDAITALCREWPLSSVGVEGLGELDLEPIRACPALVQLHLDRALDRDDRDRLQIPWVHQAAIAALGDYTGRSAGQTDPDERLSRTR